jgi:ribosome biogenesis GTPase / thiamine phosphate phosphatase
LNKGIIIKTTGSWHLVMQGEEKINCRLRGNLRMKGSRNTNPVAVGDEVEFERTSPDQGTITRIFERKNYIIRKAINLSRETQIIAANLDQAVLMITLDFPETPLEFVDRFLVSAEAYHIPVLLVINKIDFYQRAQLDRVQEIRKIYEYAGYRVFEISVLQKINTDILAGMLAGKYSAIAGNSGVGKSSFINLLCPGVNLKTAEVSLHHLLGKHTTTYPEMIALPGGGHIIDTPGIRGFGVMDIARNEIGLYFTDIFRLSVNCRFYNCSHMHEPGCAVISAYEQGILHGSRYRSYLKIMQEDDGKYRTG